MAGHSHWAGIKHKKAVNDAKKGKIFTKVARELMVAARGGSDPEMNARLRHALEKARAVSMPRDNIDRAVKKGAGELEGVVIQELTFEGYGPGGVAMIIDVITDNSNRTAPEIKKIFETRNGKFGSPGTTAWMFKRKGIFGVPKSAVGEEALMEIALDAGAEDLTDSGAVWEVTAPADAYDSVRKAIEAAGLPLELDELTYIADTEVEPDAETQKKNLALMEALEDHDDVQNVYSAFTPSEEVLAEMDGG